MLTIRTKIVYGGGIFLEMRKLQLVGRASFSVALPPDWIKEYKLKPSDQITITQEEDGSLRLVPGTMPEKKEIKITIDVDRCKHPGLLKRLIVGGYLKGCDSIELVSKHSISENHRREIRNAIDGLMGLRIIESTSDHVTIQCVIDHTKFPIVPLLKRLCELASSMYWDSLQALKDKDNSLAAGVINRENETNKIYWLSQRQLAAAAVDKSILNKVGLKRTSDLSLYRAISSRMWAVSTYAADIASNKLAIENGVSDADLQKIIRLGKMVHEINSNTCKAFFNGDVIMANNTIETFNTIEETKDELTNDVGSRIKDVQVLMHLMNIIRDVHRVGRYGRAIAEMTINNFVAEKNNLP
jgi:phosphate uptake regulator